VLMNLKKHLIKFGNYGSTARPNIKISPKEFLRIIENIGDINLVLAHIFTPYYGVLGAHNGFHDIDDIFETMCLKKYFLKQV